MCNKTSPLCLNYSASAKYFSKGTKSGRSCPEKQRKNIQLTSQSLLKKPLLPAPTKKCPSFVLKAYEEKAKYVRTLSWDQS